MSVRDKLERLYRKKSPKEPKPGNHQSGISLRGHASRINSVVPGRYTSTPFGLCFSTERTYPPGYKHGTHHLASLPPEIGESIGLLTAEDSWIGIDPRRILFFDTETTGLTQGAGTCVFLVGVGFFGPQGFTIRQYFLEDYSQERAFLYLIARELGRFQALVTFNGKAFDLPLLANRFILAGLGPPPVDYPHCDLLYPARRLWQGLLPSCALADLENHILQFHRTGDLPGTEIPGRYFHYLQTRDGHLLAPVFDHNRLDITSLATLLIHLHRFVTNPMAPGHSPAEVLALARLLEARGHLHQSEEYYRAVLEQEPGGKMEATAMRCLANLLKRKGQVKKAVPLWEELTRKETFSLDPYIELAKYYEHCTRDLDRARDMVLRAREVLRHKKALGFNLGHQPAELEHRWQRLQRKTAKRDHPGVISRRSAE